jgi:2-hydroxychromene-2-carboxylate isomerase
MSMAPIEFWFDFTSPYSYLLSEKIDALAARHGRRVHWQPIMLGAVFKTTGGRPLTEVPLKGEYSLHDFARSARFLGVPYRQPSRFPLVTLAPARAYYWLFDHDEAMAHAFAQAVFRAAFTADRDIAERAVVIELAAALGAKADDLAAALGTAAVKERLKQACDAALARGMFGAPFVVIDDEPFWGADRLPQIERWLATGGF